jgi:hypothetical protein
MKKLITSLSLVTLLLPLTSIYCAAAETADNSRLLCAITEVIECESLGDCSELTPEDVGLPDFLYVDLAEKKITEATSVSLRESRFIVNSANEGITILSGVDGLRGWSAVLSNNNTHVTASVSDERAGFVVFGNCRAEPK